MTPPELTAEDLAELRLTASQLRPDGYVPTLVMKTETAKSLISMSLELLRLKSALHYLHRESPMSTSDFEPAAILMLARQLGWQDPSAKGG